jgi:hypothetical protein
MEMDMPAQILHRGARVNCSHISGQATPNSSFARVKVSGQDVVRLRDFYSIVDCQNNPPCATGKWVSGSIRVKAGGSPVAIFSGKSTCVPTNTPMKPDPVSAQKRVLAT